jgi:2-phosphosulfolactate phosphatase
VLAGQSDVVAVVDVLSFTTTLTVAADNEIEVFPFRWRDVREKDFARERDPVLAVGRSAAGAGQISLSPATIRAATAVPRLVLPSPNGSTIVHEIAKSRATVIGVSLRNFAAAAEWIAHGAPGAPLTAVAAGERWEDGSLRPAVEDLRGAGAFLVALKDGGFGALSPETTSVAAAYQAVAADLPARPRARASGQELIGGGYLDDVDVAAEVNASTAVPTLCSESFAA